MAKPEWYDPGYWQWMVRHAEKEARQWASLSRQSLRARRPSLAQPRPHPLHPRHRPLYRMIPDPLQHLLRHLRQLDPVHRRGVEVERRQHDMEELVAQGDEDGGFVGERIGVQADVRRCGNRSVECIHRVGGCRRRRRMRRRKRG